VGIVDRPVATVELPYRRRDAVIGSEHRDVN
jgi:hypothetical protein